MKLGQRDLHLPRLSDQRAFNVLGHASCSKLGHPANLPGERCVQHATMQIHSDAAAIPCWPTVIYGWPGIPVRNFGRSANY